MQEFIDDQRRKYQAITKLRFSLNGGDRRRVYWMILQGKLNQDVAVQPGHCRLNSSSARSDWDMDGVNTRRPLSERI